MESAKNNHGSHQEAALMNRTTKYVALDVDQASTLASAREEGGRVIARSIFATEEAAILEFSAGCGARGIWLSRKTQAQWLCDVLRPRVDRVLVCDSHDRARPGDL